MPAPTVAVAVQLLPLGLATVADTPRSVTLGVWIASLAVKLSVTVFASLARAVSVLLLAMATVVRLGSVLSTVTLLLSVAAVTALAVLPTRSVTEIENAATPSAVPAPTVAVAVQLLPLGLATVAATPSKVTPGVWIVSLAVKLSVTVFASLARAVLALLLAMVTTVRVDGVLSTVTVLLSVDVVTAAKALPARSLALIENAATPSAVPAPTVAVAVQLFPLGLAKVAATPSKVTLGVWIASLAVKLSVNVFDSLARAVSALSLAMVTVVRLGSVLSTVTLLLSVVAVTAEAVLPARSVAVIENATPPSAVPAPTVAVAVQLLPLGLATVAATPSKVTLGV